MCAIRPQHELAGIHRRALQVALALSVFLLSLGPLTGLAPAQRRSGATSIPEVLRMAPGVNVAKIDSNTWSVSIRGFSGAFSNKLLVQIDGRNVYTPLFAGVFWEGQDVLLEDVDRIEVIRGLGASVWGANAVNGIINIITTLGALSGVRSEVYAGMTIWR